MCWFQVVLAVGSAMMSSVQKILQNRALNRVHNFDPVNANKPNVNYNPDGTIHDRLPFPKDLGAYMYDYMSEKEGRGRSKKRRKMADDDNKDSQKTRSYLSTSSEDEEETTASPPTIQKVYLIDNGLDSSVLIRKLRSDNK